MVGIHGFIQRPTYRAVIDAIAAVKTGRKRGHDDVPVEPVVVTTARSIAKG